MEFGRKIPIKILELELLELIEQKIMQWHQSARELIQSCQVDILISSNQCEGRCESEQVESIAE
jgi:hypothetical protein